MKIVIIGGGSYQWVPNLVADLMRTPSLAGMEIVLEDIDPKPLPDMARWVEKASEHYGQPATVTHTTDQRAALDGADAVVVTISTGGFASMSQDLAVPERYGIKQSVGDSVGPGGINRAARNIPVLVGIGKDMTELCPDAWLLNITNPMTVLTRAVGKATGIKAVGLCHEIAHVRWSFALLCGVAPDDVELTLTGINHFPVVTAVRVGDRDGFDILREVVDGTFTDVPWANEFTSAAAFKDANQLKLALWEEWGALPAAGDRHLAEFLPGFLTEESGWGERWGIRLTTIADRERDQAKYVSRVADLLSGAEEPPQGDSGEMVAPFLDCLLTGTERVMPLNLPNVGQAADLPADVVAESMVKVGANGPEPGPAVAAPAPAAELVRRHSAVQEMVVEAVLTQDRELLKAAYALDPLAGRIDSVSVRTMADELLAATEAWLPAGW